MKKFGIVRAAATLVAAVCISTTFAQTFSVNLGQNNASGAAATSAGADVVKVVARGVGTDESGELDDVNASDWTETESFEETEPGIEPESMARKMQRQPQCPMVPQDGRSSAQSAEQRLLKESSVLNAVRS